MAVAGRYSLFIILSLFTIHCTRTDDPKKLRKSDYLIITDFNTPDIKKLKANPYKEEELEEVALFALKNNKYTTRTPEITRISENILEYHITDTGLENPRVWAEHVCTRFVKKNGFWYVEWIGKVWKCTKNKESKWHKQKCVD
ncbi:MAG: hypothetical protein NZ455_04050 [Bacteroidia bacterium]|nr:hypothetical protein [Bacteroidia bacterium]MDW8347865.1 hypothetical protein [Bacteroidia bacterium]